jgi:uncharacterized protein
MAQATRQFAVVTGASSGIGYELAKQFAQNGFDLLITEHEQSTAGAKRDLEQLGASVQVVQANLALKQGVDTLVDAIRASGRPLDAIAINAGVGQGGPFIETDWEDELNIINLNIIGTAHLAKHVAQDMVARGAGKILFTSSIAALMPGTFQAVYNGSKAFVQSFAEALRNELKDTGVTVTALQPGPTDTNFFERADMEDTSVGQSSKDDPAQVAKQGFEALMAGDDHIIAGSLKTKVQGKLSGILPSTVTAEQHRKMAEPGSGE